MFRFVLACLAICLTLPAHAQSWCANGPLNPTEQTICSDPDLGWRDRQMEDLYSSVRHLYGVQSAQQGWLASRNACGWDAWCIRTAYDQRIAALQGIAAGGGGQSGGKPPAPGQGVVPSWCYESGLNGAEQTICAYPDLSQMDLYMADLYAQVRHYPGVPADQRHWLSQRNACHTNYSCLRDAYAGRIGYFQNSFGVH